MSTQPSAAASTAADEIFQRMNDGSMRNWVGLGDAGGVGRENARLIATHVNPKPGTRVLDFGCGIGRTAVALVETYGDAIEVVGTDIVPKLVDFCQTEIEPRMPNTRFQLFNVLNEHYSHHYGSKDKDGYAEGELDEAAFFAANKGAFDLFIAFSVFTHLYDFDVLKYLKHAAESIKEDGNIMCTFFLIDAESVANLTGGHPPFSFFDNTVASEDEFFFGCVNDKLGFVGVPTPWLSRAAQACGLTIHKITYGAWRLGHVPGGTIPETFQDIVVFRKRRQLPADFDPARYRTLNQDVAESVSGASWHYLRHGREENRRY